MRLIRLTIKNIGERKSPQRSNYVCSLIFFCHKSVFTVAINLFSLYFHIVRLKKIFHDFYISYKMLLLLLLPVSTSALYLM